jgi:hypothetical protein
VLLAFLARDSGGRVMGRGKQTEPIGQHKTARLPKEIWDYVEWMGDGNRTEGLKIVCSQHMEHNDTTKEPDRLLTNRIHKHIHAPESDALREKYFMFIEIWFKDQSKIWNAPMVYKLFGLTKSNGSHVKRSLKQLVTGGFVKYSIHGFKPVVRGNGGWSQEEFDIQFAQYIEIIQSRN